MCIFHSRASTQHATNTDNNANLDQTQLPQTPNGYVSGLYYSNWSPYKPRHHFPHDINTRQITHIYYAFFLVDKHTGQLKSSDEWSDFQMNTNKWDNKTDLLGCIGELFQLKLGNGGPSNQNGSFKMIMSVGGWSNRGSFPHVVREKSKFSTFIKSCVDTMFKYGFDGIDLDWEFPQDDGVEPKKYLEMVKLLRESLDRLEMSIWGQTCRRFHLSVAAPAFQEKLQTLLVKRMDPYLDLWNMMTYDYYGEWSETTGYHSNLYDGSCQLKDQSAMQLQYKGGRIGGDGNHSSLNDGHSDNQGLNGDSAIKCMITQFQIDPQKIVLGMAMYGRGFTNVKLPHNIAASHNELISYCGMNFRGVKGEGSQNDEPGMWQYNQLPIKNTIERFDPFYVSAFCYEPKTKTMVGYDNIDSILVKSQYIKSHNLAGAFWWESCGNDWKHKERSLVHAYTKEVGVLRQNERNLYLDPQLQQVYLFQYGTNGFLSKLIKSLH